MDIREEARAITSFFERKLSLGDQRNEGSPWYSPEMLLLEDEPNLPLEMRIYCEWHPFQEKSSGGWHFFPTHHVFRLPTEHTYLIAQKPDKWLLFSIKDNQWRISSTGLCTKKSPSVVEILSIP